MNQNEEMKPKLSRGGALSQKKLTEETRSNDLIVHVSLALLMKHILKSEILQGRNSILVFLAWAPLKLKACL